MEDILTLGFLILLQLVLGFDNLLYISIESKRVPVEKQKSVRTLGIGLAIVLRILLLFVVTELVGRFQAPMFGVHATGWLECEVNLHALIVLLGGAFILYTAVKEIFHMMHIDAGEEAHAGGQRSIGGAVFWIVTMNVIFSFDSILSAMALTKVFWVMAAAIVVSGGAMIWLSGHVAAFLQRNRMYEVLGLFILLIVGVMLVTEGGHLAHLAIAGNEVTAMSKTTFYFVIAVLVATDLVQSRYQRRLLAQLDAQRAAGDRA